MSFLKRIVDMATGRNKHGLIHPPYEPAEQTPAEEQAPDPEKTTASDINGASDLPPARERLGRLKTLTPREWEVYEHLIHGRTMKETAKLLGVTYPTVNFHCQGLYKKLSINTRAQLFMQYMTLDAGDVKKAREEKL